MTEARDDGIAATEVALQVLVVQRQQVGLDHREVGVLGGARREPLRRPDHGADVDAAAQKLLQDAPSGAPGAADEKNGLLRRHGFVSLDDCLHGVIPSLPGYWNTSSSGTPKTRAIWNAISREGE